MIYVTGDTHGFLNFDKIIQAIKANQIKSGDYLIIAGDFGGVWDKTSLSHTISLIDALPCTILFVDGNHENFDILNSFPMTYWNNGKIHKISHNLLHLMRGQVYLINNISILTLGGAESTDKEYRIPFVSWWPNESINIGDIIEAKTNLGNLRHVDYIVTHTCAEQHIVDVMLELRKDRKIQTSEILLNNLCDMCTFKQWFFGHWHMDIQISNNVRAVYNDIRRLD